MKFASRLLWAIAFTGLSSVVATRDCSSLVQRVQTDLSPELSRKNLISTTAPARWSDFGAPNPGVVVNVASESDVVATVRLHDSYIPSLPITSLSLKKKAAALTLSRDV